MTSPRISRSNSTRSVASERGRTDSPSRRPKLDRRDSSPMARVATFGLLATSGIGQALGAPILDRAPSPVPPRALTHAEQDMARAMDIIRRGEDPYAHVDYSAVNWADNSLYKGVDWSKVEYAIDSPSVYGSPQAMPSPTLSSMGRAYEATFGEPSPLATPTTLTRGFAPTLPPILAARPVPSSTLKVANPSPTSPAPLLNVDPPAPQAPFAAAPIDFFAGLPETQNAVAVDWHGDREMTFSFFANAGPYQPNLSEAYHSVTLQPGTSATVQLPKGWSGRVQKMTGAIDSDATWAEFTFGGFNDLTWFDDSYIRGYNGPVEMYLADTPDLRAGSREDMLKLYPLGKQAIQPRGAAIPATEGYDGSIHFDIIDWWRSHNRVYPASANIAERLEAYIVHDDDKATMTGKSRHLVTAWY